jgi:hypothetical protein
MVQTTLLLLLSSTTITLASFGPDVRIDRLNLPNHSCRQCAITLGPGAPSSQPLYVAFEDNSTLGIAIVRADIMFQKSTDAGRTWLPTAVLVRDGAPHAYDPDITTDSDGNVYIVWEDWYVDTAGGHEHRILCVRSSDGGATWSAPARVDDRPKGSVGWPVRIAADSAGNLFCVWHDWRTGFSHIWSSVSTDRGATWSRNVQVDDDTTDHDCSRVDVSIQPGTNHYLVAAKVARWFEHRPHIRSCAFPYRSTDMGRTFQPGVQLDTFDYYGGWPHVVADRDHIICDYFGSGRLPDSVIAEARTFYTQADSWGSPAPVTNLDSLHELYESGALALSGDGRVHTALRVRDTTEWQVYYTSSSDHGVSWSDLELVNDDVPTYSRWYPDIGADIAGHAYVVWEDFDGDRGTIWFSTNAPAAIAEQPLQQPVGMQPSATVVRGVLVLGGNGDSPSGREDARYSPHFPVMSRAALLDISGRKVLGLRPGANDVGALAPGVYFVRQQGSTTQGFEDSSVGKVVITR